MKKKITKRVIQNDVKPKAKPFQIHCTACRGFIIRIQPSGEASYYFQYRIPGSKTAERRKILIGRLADWSLGDAQLKAEEYRNAVARGLDPGADLNAPADPALLTLRQFVTGRYTTWAQTGGNLKSHAKTLPRLITGFEPLLDRPLQDLTFDDFDRHRTWRAENILEHAPKAPSTATTNRDLAHMRACLSKAVAFKLLDHNPLKVPGLLGRETKKATIRAITVEEEAAFLQVFESRRVAQAAQWAAQSAGRKRPLPPLPHFESALEPLFILSLDTGLRQGESRTLLWADVDLKKKEVTVRAEMSKSGEPRMVPLSDRATAALEQWQKQTTDTGDIFPATTAPWVTGVWRTLCNRAKVTGLRWHDLRHSFGSRCARAGVSIMTIRSLMGHATIVTTQRYLHSTADDARAAIKLMSK